MNKLLSSITTLSYKRIIISAIIAGAVLGSVMVGYRAQNRTDKEKRLGPLFIQSTPQITKRPFGPIPQNPPNITQVFPWVGKTGDVILIEGDHFGDNPLEKQIIIGQVPVTEDQILDWTDDEIQALIPAGSTQGGSVEVRVGTHSPAVSLPFVLYDASTKLQLKKIGTMITALSPDQIRTIRWWGALGDTVTVHEVRRSVPSDPVLFDTQREEIRSLLLYDAAGTMLPYYVDPEEFGF